MSGLVSIAGAGDNVVDCYRSAGRMFPGGNTVNVAAFAARLGARAAYVGQVAPDSAGEHIAQSLAAEGVDVSRLRRARGRTAYCVIGHDEHGDRAFLSFDLGVSRFDPSADDIDALAGFDAVHVGATSGLDQHLEAFASATRLSYDFATRADPDHIARVGRICFLAVHSGGDLDDTAFAELLERSEASGAQWSLVTRGTRGAVLSHRGRRWSAAARTERPALDTLGAGDSFAARVLVGILRDEDPPTILAAAAEIAAETCQRLGAFGPGIPIDPTILAAGDDSPVLEPLTTKEHR
ncbi:putative Fructosamine kinase FrlD [Microbacterium sp. 8M]|uniref:PfkB family carbohydrate kinase n=1 Tax=Microbacterium sp. 8M TaxID=2653153 RepID=UPI0012F33E54|nr:PfkB family carbohydrate kinase [Microbacterium sp. 8M]VXB35203.1 putative Fructosamine kinase FrlD [Microbacterium sp. 8M]